MRGKVYYEDDNIGQVGITPAHAGKRGIHHHQE